MSTPTVPARYTAHTIQTPAATCHDWAEDLSAYLGPTCLPAAHDDLAATLLRRHAPSHLLWRLSALPRNRRFASMAELLDYLDAPGSHAAGGLVAGLFPDPTGEPLTSG